jgi:hypothetical protein
MKWRVWDAFAGVGSRASRYIVGEGGLHCILNVIAAG